MSRMTDYRRKYAIIGGLLVPLFGRISLFGTGHATEYYRYVVPLFVGSVAGFLIGKMKNHWILKARLLEDEIRKRKSVEQNLLSQKEHLAVTLRSIGDGVITTDLVGNVVLLNNVAEKLTGWKNRDAAGISLPDVFVISNERTGVPCENPVEQVLASGKIVELPGATLLTDKNGNQYNIEDSAAPIFDKNDTIIGIIIVFRNVTGRRQSEKQLSKIIDLVPAMIFVKNKEGKFLAANQAIADSYLMTTEKIIGRLHADIHPDQQQVEKMLADDRKALELGETITIPREPYFDSSGNTRWLQTIKVPCAEDVFGEPAIVGIATDITEQVILEEELLKVKKLESVGVLAGGIAHDFNNILAAILGNIELAEIHTDAGSKAYPLLENAKKASIRAKDLTKQLLTFSKGGDPVKQTSCIGKIAVDSADFILHGSSSVCEYEIPDDLWQVEVDTGQISQVIQNIVLNARDSMPNGGVIRVTCENIADITKERVILPEKKYIRLSIADTGVGIPEEYLDKVFDPYFSTKQKGSGLGLSICHSIIKKHGGNIAVRSSADEGTTFVLYLPTSEKAAKAAPQAEKVFIQTDRSGTVMIMDDDAMVRDMAKQILELAGYTIILVKNGQEAIATYAKALEDDQPIDIIIMDLTIPGGMGGKLAVQEILKLNSQAKVVVASGYSNDPVMAHYKDYGFQASIAKPYQLTALHQLVSSILADSAEA